MVRKRNERFEEAVATLKKTQRELELETAKAGGATLTSLDRRIEEARKPSAPRTQFGRGIHNSGAKAGGYSYATASEDHAFHAITMDFGSGALAIHGYILRDGERSKVVSGTRRVLERDARTAYPLRVALDLVDETGREVHAEGECRNNPAGVGNATGGDNRHADRVDNLGQQCKQAGLCSDGLLQEHAPVPACFGALRDDRIAAARFQPF